MGPIFISYARRASQSAARLLRDDLTASGLTVFLDEREIPFGAAFPAELTRGLLDARVVVLFADAAYFDRPWCVHELRLMTAAYRAGDANALASVVVVLPTEGDLDGVTAQLPPPLAAASWPNALQREAIAETVRQVARQNPGTLRERLTALNDDTVATMLTGADQPLPWRTPAPAPTASGATVATSSTSAAAPAGPPAPGAIWSIADAPASKGTAFVGRADVLWQLVHECVTARAFTPARTVVLRGLGGCGKSQLAGELVARHARRAFPAGVIWIDAEGGEAALREQLSALWRELAPGQPLPDDPESEVRTRLQALRQALDAILRERTSPGDLLWVIDGLPEPGRDSGGLNAWCPSLHHVSVLATTRRADTLRDADATIVVGALARAAARELLTRPPVDPRWMKDDEWTAVVRWAGDLPLVLTVLRESLIDGSLAVDSLRQAPQAEPAAESERLMDGLRGEVDDTSLRGAAEAFELSWQSLAADESLADAACRLALLAPVSLDEPLLDDVAGAAAVGKLVRRGWLQPAGAAVAGRRAFTLHRVPASVLRLKIADLSATFAEFFNGLARVIEHRTRKHDTGRLELHLHVAMGHLFRTPPTVNNACIAAAHAFVIAVMRRVEVERSGLRYLAASVAHAFRLDEACAEALRAAIDPNDDKAVASVPHTLQPLRDSPTAIAWLTDMLSDTRDMVRWQALVHADTLEAPALATPLLQAILREPRADHAASFEPYLKPPYLRASLSMLADALMRGDAVARRRVASLMGRALILHGPGLEAGGFSAQHLLGTLTRLALSDEDADVREEAASSAGYFFHARTWQTLREAVSSADAEGRSRALAAIKSYLGAATAPRRPKGAQFSRDDEGRLTITARFGDAADLLPDDVPETLIGWVLSLGGADADAAAAALASLRQGLAACSPRFYDLLSAGDVASARRLADALLRAKPDFVNAKWWRGLASARLEDDEGACADFDAVLLATPGFTDAIDELHGALLRCGWRAVNEERFDAAVPLLLRAAGLKPDDVQAQHLASGALYNLGRYEEAEASASRTIALAPALGEAYYFRGLSRRALDRLPDAIDDFRQAATLGPQDPRPVEQLQELGESLLP